MARVAVIHPRFDTKGGAEVVCLNVLEALQHDHDLHVFSFDEPDFAALNEFCGTDVDPVPTWHPERLRPAFEWTGSVLTRLSRDNFGNLDKFRTALLNPLVRRRTREFDLRVSTGGEMALPEPTLQYVHLPIFNGRFDAKYGANGPLSVGHDWFCSRLAGIDRTMLAEATLLANSDWTAEVVESRYGVRPRVLRPPVTTDQFYEVPWDEREDGFVTLGRISPDKNTLEVIRIVEAVRERGHDVHLHVVGPTAPHCTAYRDQVDRLAAGRDWISLEGEISRSELVDLVCTHRYGIHAKPTEHFGIAVAELVAGGTVPFVPADGGQVELVGGQPELLYSSLDEAVDRIDDVLSDAERVCRCRDGLPDLSELQPERFQRQISAYVDDLV